MLDSDAEMSTNRPYIGILFQTDNKKPTSLFTNGVQSSPGPCPRYKTRHKTTGPVIRDPDQANESNRVRCSHPITR